jgi:hypothetical protein
MSGRTEGIPAAVIFRRTVNVPWDDLDVQACGHDGQPDWSTLVVTGPTRRRGPYGQSSLEWTVSVQCQPSAATTAAEPR